MTMPRTVDMLLHSYPPEVQALASAARKHLRRVLPKIEERADEIGARHRLRLWARLSQLDLHADPEQERREGWAVRGSELADPNHLLEGSGKVHRHIALRTAADLRRPGVTELIQQTLAAWRLRTGN